MNYCCIVRTDALQYLAALEVTLVMGTLMFLFIFFVMTISYVFGGAVLCALNHYSELSLC